MSSRRRAESRTESSERSRVRSRGASKPGVGFAAFFRGKARSPAPDAVGTRGTGSTSFSASGQQVSAPDLGGGFEIGSRPDRSRVDIYSAAPTQAEPTQAQPGDDDADASASPSSAARELPLQPVEANASPRGLGRFSHGEPLFDASGAATSSARPAPGTIDDVAEAHVSVHVKRIMSVQAELFSAEIFVDAAWLYPSADEKNIESIITELNAPGSGLQAAGEFKHWTPRIFVHNAQRWLREGDPRVWFSAGARVRRHADGCAHTMLHMRLSGLAILEVNVPAAAIRQPSYKASNTTASAHGLACGRAAQGGDRDGGGASYQRGRRRTRDEPWGDHGSDGLPVRLFDNDKGISREVPHRQLLQLPEDPHSRRSTALPGAIISSGEHAVARVLRKGTELLARCKVELEEWQQMNDSCLELEPERARNAYALDSFDEPSCRPTRSHAHSVGRVSPRPEPTASQAPTLGEQLMTLLQATGKALAAAREVYESVVHPNATDAEAVSQDIRPQASDVQCLLKAMTTSIPNLLNTRYYSHNFTGKPPDADQAEALNQLLAYLEIHCKLHKAIIGLMQEALVPAVESGEGEARRHPPTSETRTPRSQEAQRELRNESVRQLLRTNREWSREHQAAVDEQQGSMLLPVVVGSKWSAAEIRLKQVPVNDALKSPNEYEWTSWEGLGDDASNAALAERELPNSSRLSNDDFFCKRDWGTLALIASAGRCAHARGSGSATIGYTICGCMRYHMRVHARSHVVNLSPAVSFFVPLACLR